VKSQAENMRKENRLDQACVRTSVMALFIYRNFVRHIRESPKSNCWFLRACLPVPACLSVRPHGTTRLTLDGYSWHLIFDNVFENLPRKFKFHSNMTRITGAVCTCMAVSGWNLIRMRNVSDKSCTESQNIFLFSIFLGGLLSIYDIMWKIIVQPDRPQMMIRRMRIACWIIKVKHALKICNYYWFSVAKIVTRTRLDVNFIQSLPILFCFLLFYDEHMLWNWRGLK